MSGEEMKVTKIRAEGPIIKERAEGPIRVHGRLPKRELERLAGLAEKINAEHRACEAAANTALAHGINAGGMLSEVKASLTHGEFGAWLKENFAGSDRTARAYMRVYAHREELEAKRQSSANLSLDGALKALSTPKSESQDSEPKDEMGGALFGLGANPKWDQDAHPAAQKYPLLRYGSFGNVKPEQLDSMYEKLEEMDEDARAETLMRIRPRPGRTEEDNKLLRWLAGFPDPVADEESEDFAERVAKFREASRAAEEREYKASRKKHGARFLGADAELSTARRAGKKALEQILAVEFSAEEVELLKRELEAAQRMLGLVGAALTGDSGTDWDAELFALEQRRQWGE